MAISRQGTDVGGGGNPPVGVNHTLVAGTSRRIIFWVAIEGTGTLNVATATYGGVSMIKADQVLASAATSQALALFYLDEANLPANGSNTLAVTTTGTLGDQWWRCAQHQGIAQGGPIQIAKLGEGAPADATIDNTITALGSSQWAFSCVISGNLGSFTHTPASQIEPQVGSDFQSASQTGAYTEIQGGAGETSLTSTFTGTNNRLLKMTAVWGVPGNTIDVASFNLTTTTPFSD